MEVEVVDLLISAEYPFAGTYNVTLSVFNSQGNAQNSQPVQINTNDLVFFPLHLLLLTGGPLRWSKLLQYRKWHIDSACATISG